ncbi:hypothetical protein Mp_1g02300 [Marchantia polymorpha subsp. ruderalis]|uniref:Uncharacterized protein n=2 Tax=Marchantia polymorpha TaxID=3197 RepID=A0AAF6AKN9_MARPO|nr:hypothetical protein MARPO_0029s0017 [Marchantia polymorpha]BBM97009.1 hypothetical protein Mp_1g02300 [Marchantia polymorpha subsp. ruderalis]|eukprot:PTQ42472.1 hypothetical protein MARPO_0029s0017 [Marchantia polymorpha]
MYGQGQCMHTHDGTVWFPALIEASNGMGSSCLNNGRRCKTLRHGMKRRAEVGGTMCSTGRARRKGRQAGREDVVG